MTPKELMYVEDALGHAQFLKTQSQTAANQLKDGTLRNRAQQIAECSEKLFRRFYGLV